MLKIAEKKTLGSTKRFGTRYGRTVKEKLLKVERLAKATYKCPYCHKKKVKKENIGIWLCKKCGSKFTGKAYTIIKKNTVKELIMEEEPEEIIKDENIKKSKEEKGIKYPEKKEESKE